VFLGRFTAFFRAMMPALAGASHMPYRKFLAWNAFGGVVWGSVFVVVGYVAGASYQQVEKQVGRGIAVALVVVVIGLLVAWRLRARKERHGASHSG
jgi:membrane protein DedA with SNARE-associated domain